jgi:alpha-L-rhamnosidase
VLTVTRLRCEHQENPVGIGESRPRFSWVLDSDAVDVHQRCYRLQVSMEADFATIFWDTGERRSGQSVLVEYAGPSLGARARYFWRVQARDNRGDRSPWSETSFFETALDPSSWSARFVSPEPEDASKSSAGMLLRKEFSVSGEVAAVRVYATALGLYELRINGQPVGGALFTPGWTSYKKRLLYQTFDATGLVRQGLNAVAATVGCGWYKGDLAGWLGLRNVYGSRTALLAQVHVRYADGREEVTVTDATWTCAPGPILYSEIYHGETYDARREQAGHDQPGFLGQGWKPAGLLDPGLERQYRAALRPQDGPPVRRQERLKPRSLFTTPRGERVLDFGQNLTGRVRFTVRGAPGDTVVLRHAEVLDAQGNFYTANLRGAKARVEYVLRGGEPETFEPHFTFQGFRYVMIQAFPGVPSPDSFEAVVIHSALEPAGAFRCSNELVNALHRNILWSLKGNFLVIPTDCPQRDERLGWTGDAQVFIRTALHLVQAVPFYRKWLRDLAADQVEGGGVPFVVPDVLTGATANDPLIRQPHSSTGWGDAAVICPWSLYESSGDSRILAEQWQSMKAWVEYIRARAQGGVLWNTGFHFADWVALDAKEGSYFGATPNDLVATAYYAYSSHLLWRSAAVLGRGGEVRRYRRLHRNITEAFRKEFITPSGRMAARTQTAHVLALAFDLVPPAHRRRVVEDLAALVRENGGHLTTGFLGTPHLCRVLAENGRLEDAYALLLRDDYPSWLYQVTRGASTIWEHWDGIKPDGTMWSPNMNSFNHYAYGAIGEWLHRAVAGVRMEADRRGRPGLVFQPRPGAGLSSAEADLMTPWGRAAVSWSVFDGRITVEVTVPHNTSARIVLPAATRSLLGPQAGSFHNCRHGAETHRGSGTYRFDYPFQSPSAPAT